MQSATPFWISKTFWTNLVVLVAMACPAVRGWLDDSPANMGMILAGVNIALKLITHKQHSMVDDTVKPDQDTPWPSWLVTPPAPDDTVKPGQDAPLSTTHETPSVPSAQSGAAEGRTANNAARLGVLALLLLPLVALGSCGSQITYDTLSKQLIIKDSNGRTLVITNARVSTPPETNLLTIPVVRSGK